MEKWRLLVVNIPHHPDGTGASPKIPGRCPIFPRCHGRDFISCQIPLYICRFGIFRPRKCSRASPSLPSPPPSCGPPQEKSQLVTSSSSGWSVVSTHTPSRLTVFKTRDAVQPLVITPGKELNGKYGVYRHSDLIGVPYGSKIGSRNGKGFIHVLRPTPELWTLALPHRTQILYLADIAFVSSWLNIKPGSHVIEAGMFSPM